MKRIRIGWIVIGALVGGAASAADLPLPGQTYKNVEYYNWTGPYLGINGGGAWGHSRQDQILPPALTTGDFSVSGGLAGGTAGFNLQVDRVVFGLEGDLDWAHISGNTTCRLGAFTCATQSDYLATARGRLGFVWSAQWLAYLTGGAALGDVNQSFAKPVGINNGAISNRVGWTAGAGLQIGLWNPQSSNWSVKFEYLYVNLGTFSCAIACSGIVGQTTNTTLIEGIFRTGIDYRF